MLLASQPIIKSKITDIYLTIPIRHCIIGLSTKKGGRGMVSIKEGKELVEEFAEIIAPMTDVQRERVKDALAVVKFFSSQNISSDSDAKSSRSA